MTSLVSQDFDTGTNGGSYVVGTNESTNGTGTLSYSNVTPITGTLGLLASGGVGAYASVRHTFTTPQTGVWHALSFVMPTTPAASSIYFMVMTGAANAKICDVRINVDQSITIRNEAGVAKYTSPVIAAGTRVRVSVKGFPGSTTGLRLRLYLGTNYAGTTPTHDSGDLASTSSLTAVNDVAEGLTAAPSANYTLLVDAVRVDNATEPAAPSPVNADTTTPAPATHNQVVSEDFTTGPSGSAIVIGTGENITGSATPATLTYDAVTPIQGSFGMKVTAATNYAWLNHAFTSAPGCWHDISFVMPAAPPTNLYIASVGNVSTVVCDVRINTSRAITIRNEAGVARYTSPVIPVGTRVRLTYKAFPGSSTGLRLRLYLGPNYTGTTPDFDSGDLASTSPLTAVSFAREGILAAPTGSATVTLDRIRVDTLLEPPPPLSSAVNADTTTPAPVVPPANVAPTVVAGPPQTSEPFLTVTLTAVGTDTDGVIAFYTWRGIGNSLVLTGATGPTPTFPVPSVRSITNYTFGVTATDDGGLASAEDTVVITVLPVTEWAVIAGVEVPMLLTAA